jgi:hypothetical protein
MGAKSCGVQRPKKKHHEENQKVEEAGIKRQITMKKTMHKLFPHGKYFYNKETG